MNDHSHRDALRRNGEVYQIPAQMQAFLQAPPLNRGRLYDMLSDRERAAADRIERDLRTEITGLVDRAVKGRATRVEIPPLDRWEKELHQETAYSPTSAKQFCASVANDAAAKAVRWAMTRAGQRPAAER